MKIRGIVASEGWRQPAEIRVVKNVEGVPVSLQKSGKREKITRIYDRWYAETEKDYFRVKTSKGLVYDIYHDTTNDCWYIAKIYE